MVLYYIRFSYDREENSMVEVEKITIPELTGEETRNLYLYLPQSYYEQPDRHYPVLYMFDGHNVFFDSDATYGKSWGMKEYMDSSQTQMIIAAVECNHSPDHGRLREYAPYTFREKSFGSVRGLGKVTMNWLTHTLKPQIDSRFRTLPGREHTFIAGSSMGGLMSLYALIACNEIFSGAAALSPSIWTAPGRLENLIRRTPLQPDTVLYMDYGEKELPYRADMRAQFSSLTSLLLEKEVLLTARIIPGGEHCEASWEKQIPIFMRVLEKA